MTTVILEVNKHFFKYCIFFEIDVWMSNHAYLIVFVTGYQGHMIQMRAHNWLITLCGINEFENEIPTPPAVKGVGTNSNS